MRRSVDHRAHGCRRARPAIVLESPCAPAEDIILFEGRTRWLLPLARPLPEFTVPQDTIPVEITDPVNARILAVSEDRIAGFLVDPFAEIARLAELPVDVVLERIRAMLAAGTIRRVRQTLM